MLLLHCSPRLLHRLSPSHRLAAAPFALSARRLRRSTAIRAEPEPPPTSAAEAPDTVAGTSGGDGDGEGPVELRASTLFSIDDNPTPLQTATSILLTGAISIFLFRSLRRRARRAKELRVRSSGVQKKPNNLTDEALEGLRLMSASPIEADKPPSPVQTLLGGIAAGVIAVILYKFTTTIEASLNRQTISDSFSVRQITITIRTIITGVCYLATSVFGINAVGLTLYSLQLTFASIMDDDPKGATGNANEQSNTMASSDSSTSNSESAGSDLQQMSDKSKNSTE
ncbi:hypothetical protein EJB05_24053 [Eragrostis curvula]|uniref:DUF3082 domain-containing protein n=1 Tax=Eragrostis curvula TaxID=38414 RepID=A0A5J9V9N3_9POAL|nr:hypothetical protein EJB05_24053 [Eragrostis curvula]